MFEAVHELRFNYIDDTVCGFVAVAESDSCVGEVVNVGSGFEVFIGDLVASSPKA